MERNPAVISLQHAADVLHPAEPVSSTPFHALFTSTKSVSMRGIALLPLLAAPAFADYAGDLLKTLNGAGLTTLAQAITNISTTSGGKALIGLLSDTKSNFTVFAPTNQGFAGAFANTTGPGDAPGLANIISYHVVAGDLQNYTSSYPNTTIGRTYLNAGNLVQLEGGKSQVLAWSNLNGNTTILNQKSVSDFSSASPHMLTRMMTAHLSSWSSRRGGRTLRSTSSTA
jgi:uncharacterized surface protein with fasciclin (FAS1) repeats